MFVYWNRTRKTFTKKWKCWILWLWKVNNIVDCSFVLNKRRKENHTHTTIDWKIMDESLKDQTLPTFKSIGDECAYWKERYIEVKQKLADVKQEFTDFEDNSRQLEAELETCLEQREKTIQDLKHSLDQLQTDNESLRVRSICISQVPLYFGEKCIWNSNDSPFFTFRKRFRISKLTIIRLRQNIPNLERNLNSCENIHVKLNSKMMIWNGPIVW